MSDLMTLVARVKRSITGESDSWLVERYVLNELTREEKRAVEERLENDAAFFEYAMPLINFFLFGPPPKVDPIVAAVRAEAEAEAFWHRTRTALDLPPAPYQPSVFEREASLFARLARWVDGHLLQFTLVMAGALAAVIAVFFGIPRAETALGGWNDAREGRADWRWIADAKGLQTDAFQRSRLAMADSSVVELGPSSRVHYHGLGPRDAGLARAQIAVDGDATLLLPPSKAYVTIRTHEIDGWLTAGVYHIHATPKSGVTTIVVDSGEATVHGLQNLKAEVKLGPGQHAALGVTGRR